MSKEYKLVSGEMNKKYQTAKECAEMHPMLATLIASLVKSMKANSLKTGVLTFSKDNDKYALKFVNDRGNGEILIAMIGEKQNLLGMPYYSSWDGLFYRLPKYKKKPFVKNGQFVKSGSPVGIIFINKNEQFVLKSPRSGKIFFPKEDAHLDRAVPVRAHTQDDIEANDPLFYLN